MCRGILQIITLTAALYLSSGAELKCFIDIMFLLDSSGSIGKADFNTQLHFVKQFVHEFQVGPKHVQIGVVTFSDTATTQFHLNTYSNEQSMVLGIGRIPYISGGTNTAGGLDFIRQHSFTSSSGDRDLAPNILIVLTDGRSNNGLQTKNAAKRFHDVKILAVGVGSGVDQTELHQIASRQDLAYSSASYAVLHQITQTLKSEACKTISRVEFKPAPTNGSTGGSDGGSSNGNDKETTGVPMVNQGGVWAEICGDGVDAKDAKVICRTLGYGNYLHPNRSGHLAEYSNFIDSGSVEVVTDVIECTGNEARIILCPLREQTGGQSCHKRVVINCVPTLSEAISSHCTSSHWNISIDMGILNITYPGSIPANIYLGDGTCIGTLEDGYRLVFKQDLLACATKVSYSDTNKIYTNKLVYAFHDTTNPLIIRNYNWTIGATCLHGRDQSVNTQISFNQTHTSNTTVSTSARYNLLTEFYTDPHFANPISGNPLQVNVGSDVFMKVSIDSSDWSVKMRLDSCYVHPSHDSTSTRYFLIKDGCEVDRNTHIISTAAHESRFVFKMVQIGTGNDVYIHCDAVFCSTSSQGCSQTCV